ncbi:hypothetical protein [Sphingobacterium bovistauri]|uniref:Trypsin-like peptidase domain-containing protein n=1 Tax=Sphingobacterium bovistauri TaxID=2781959 RepID=A0ABS7Z6Q0_9SPHI|nr:hypothetical protein [Sphingobacterium bovistauri]MCA5005825.1 hypothetical protein [Sphingobacterium bovistauri]
MFSRIPEDRLYCAWRIKTTFKDDLGKTLNGSGTCFFVKNSMDEVCLVTNRHLIDVDYKKPNSDYKEFKLITIEAFGKKRNIENMPDIDCKVMFYSFKILTSPKYENDVEVLKELRAYNDEEYTANVDYILPFNEIATEEQIKTGLKISDSLVFPGFPSWYDKIENRPILRPGMVSSDPRYNYSYGNIVIGDCLAYEAFSFEGSSGSPVFALQRGFPSDKLITWPDYRPLLLVGINAGSLLTNNNAHSGISYLYKSSIIIELMNQ